MYNLKLDQWTFHTVTLRSIYFFFKRYIFFIGFRERRREEREIFMDSFPYTYGPGIEPVTFQCIG